MHEYHSLRPAKALTNALERLMIAIDNADLEGNHALLLEYRKACELLGYDPAMAQWAATKEVSIASQQNLADEVQVNYFHALNPEE
jgi:hypothetical protein